MLITDRFVLLNLPKTGSTFARTVIKEIYLQRIEDRTIMQKALQMTGIAARPFIQELYLANIQFQGEPQPPSQHGTYIQIPEQYRDRPVVSIVRNPYSRFMSIYDFKYWKGHPPISRQLIEDNFPNYPKLSIDEFVLLSQLTVIHGRLAGERPKCTVGNQTVQFIQMFFKDPKEVLRNLSDEYLDSDEALHDIADIHFLRQEFLYDDLAEYLLLHGFSQGEIQYMRGKKMVHVTEEKSENRDKLWTRKSFEYVSHCERMIFRILELRESIIALLALVISNNNPDMNISSYWQFEIFCLPTRLHLGNHKIKII